MTTTKVNSEFIAVNAISGTIIISEYTPVQNPLENA